MKVMYYFLIILVVSCSQLYSQDSTFNVVGLWHTQYPVTSVEVDSNKAYIGRGNEFDILDISDQKNPKLVSEYYFPTKLIKIINFNDNKSDKIYSAVLCPLKGIYILDVTDPFGIKTIYRLPYPYIEDIDITGDHKTIYGITNDSLFFINITDIQNPRYYTVNKIRGSLIRTYSGHLFVYEGDGIYIYEDSTITTNPVPVSSFKPTINAPGYWTVGSNFFGVSNNTILISCDFGGETLGQQYSTSELKTVNIADIKNPVETNNAYDVPLNISLKSGAINNNLAYAITSDNKLDIIDINKDSVIAQYGNLTSPYQIGYGNNNVFIAEGNDGMQIINVASSANLFLNGSYSIPKPFYPADGITVHGNYCYMIDLMPGNYDGGIRILDVSDKSNPKLVGSADIQKAGYNEPKVIYYDDFLYAFSANDFFVFDVSNKTNPNLVFTSHYSGGILDEKLANNKLYILQKTTRNLSVWDLTSPGKPQFTDSVAVLAGAYKIDCDNNTAVVGNYNKVQFLSLNGKPQILFTSTLNCYIKDLKLKSSLLSIVDVNINGLINYTVNFNIPTVTKDGQFKTTSGIYANDILLKDTLCYLHDYWDGIYLIDNSDVDKPKALGTYNISNSHAFTLDNFGYMYVTQPDEGLYILRNNIVTGIKSDLINSSAPASYKLSQNYPNPFNPSTTIKYSTARATHVKLIIYDALGRIIKTLVDGEKATGNYTVNFDGSNLPSGVYFYQIKAGDFIETRKMLLLK